MERAVWIVALTTFLIDQTSKVIVVFYLDLKTVLFIEVFPQVLNFTMAWNYGVNFGLFSSDSSLQRLFLILFAILVSAFVNYWIKREPTTKIGLIGAGSLIGGALGNASDRLLYGSVADFINLSCCGIHNPFAFNLADAFIFAGVICFALLGTPKSNL